MGCNICPNVARIQTDSSHCKKIYQQASTLSDEEHQLELTEDDFIVIQWKMDEIDQKLNDLYRN